MKVVVLTSDKYLWAIRPFAYLFQRYWSTQQHVIVCGYTEPNFSLPSNFDFYSISSSNYEQERWSDALISILENIRDSHFCLLLEDYWLIRTVDVRGVAACLEYAQNRPNVLRFDLTDDRQYAGGVKDVDRWGSYDIIETGVDTPYQMSLQAALWNVNLMRKLAVPGKTAWEFEIHTSVPESMRVLGTRQCPVRYANGIYKGKVDWQQVNRIDTEHRNFITSLIMSEAGGMK